MAFDVRTTVRLLGIALLTTVAVAAVPQVARAQESDEQIQDRVMHRLETTATVKRYDLNANVHDGTAVLTGTVATGTEKSEAAQLAQVPGVHHVDNQIAVDRAVDRTLTERAKSGMRRSGEAISDSWITTKVKWFFLDDSALKGSHIDVTTDKRVVTLSGTVPSRAARTHAIALVNDTDGVVRVVDRLSVGR